MVFRISYHLSSLVKTVYLNFEANQFWYAVFPRKFLLIAQPIGKLDRRCFMETVAFAMGWPC